MAAPTTLTESARMLPARLWRARRGVWSSGLTLGLRCDLASLPEVPAARIPIVMRRVAPATFTGFAEEARRDVDGSGREARQRDRMCTAGVERLYLATSPEGEPAYAQWLVTAADQAGIHALLPGLYPRLAPDEALLEGAYTFTSFRGCGAMADGMLQLLKIARDEGLRSVVTFVAADYPPSIRGCARAGFALDGVRLDRRRLGRRRIAFRPVDAEATDAWSRATSR